MRPTRSWRALSTRLLACALLLVAGDLRAQAATPSELVAERFVLPDGVTSWALELRWHPAGRIVDGDVEALAVVIPGSGCNSLAAVLPTYFRGLPLAARIVSLQKRHVGRYGGGHGLACGARFIADDHPSQWLADQSAFLAQALASAQDRSARGKRALVLLVGISEGAETAVRLARRFEPAIDRVLLIGTSGAEPLDAWQAAVRQSGLDLTREGLDGAARRAIARGDARTIHERSARYWVETADMPFRADLLALRMPVDIAIGDADPFAPWDVAGPSLAALLDRPGSSVRVHRFRGADHALCTPSGCALETFFSELGDDLAAAIRSRP